MTDEDFAALQARVARLVAETAEAAEDLLAEIKRRERGEDATVTPLIPRPGTNSGP